MNVFEDLRVVKKMFHKIERNLQCRKEGAFVRSVERLNEIAEENHLCIKKGDVQKSLCESGSLDYFHAQNELEKAEAAIDKVIYLIGRAQSQPKKRLSPKKKKEKKNNAEK